MIWSDETKFNLDGPNRISFYWHDIRRNERVFSKGHSGWGGIIVWGYLVVLAGRQHSTNYIESPETYLLRFMGQKYGNNCIFMQDEAAIDTSSLTLNRLDDADVDVLDWSFRTPDWNPIENLWGVFARAVFRNGRQFDNIQTLLDCVMEFGGKFYREALYTLVRSMSKRCVSVIERNGLETKY